MDFSDKEINKFDFSVPLVMLFNPKLLPKMSKPSESDFQDTKLLFYYPDEGVHPEEKRNQVGLVEGSYHFWEVFSPQNDKNDDDFACQVIYLQDYIHVLKEVERNFWLLIIIRPFIDISGVKVFDHEYLNNQTFTYNENCFYEENCQRFLSHFYQTFFLFYGSFESFFSVEENCMRKEFYDIMKAYFRSYIALNCHFGHYLNILKYNLAGVNYSPIDKKKFLALQYLINILQSIEGKLEHFALFYSGFYVYSTLEQKDLQIVYDYFYNTYNSCEIDNAKILNRFEKNRKEENPIIFYGLLNKTPNNNLTGFLYGPSGLTEAKLSSGSKAEEIFPMFSPVISIFDSAKKTYSKQNLFAFFDKNLLVLMTCNSESSIEKNKFLEIQKAICSNSEKVSQNLEKQLVKITTQLENYKMVYFNKMNLALKISNKISLANLDYETLKFIDDIKNELEEKDNLFLEIKKSPTFWVYGIKGNSRIVTFLIPSNVSFQKVEEEKEEIMKYFFSNIFL